MEKINKILPTNEKEAACAMENPIYETDHSPLLNKMRHNYSIFGGISLIFGISAAILFYKAGIGINIFLFSLVMIGLLVVISKKLEVPVKKVTIYCYTGVVLLGLSNMLTSNGNLYFLNSVGMLLLLDVSLIWQFCSTKQWNFTKHLLSIFALPMKCIASVRMPFIDSNNFFKKTKLLKNDKVRNILIGCVIAIPLLLIISALLSSADLLFGRITENFYDFLFSNDIYLIVLIILIAFILCYSIICGALRNTEERIKNISKADPVIAITVSSLLLILYLIFCWIQAAYLFASGLFELPVEFTYAQYARRGFFELLAVTCINLLLILLCMNVFRENKLLKLILTAITACTYIMIAAAAYRMFLYISVYHITFLRLFVLLFLLIDALILAGIVISLFSKNFPLFGYCIAVISICYLVFSFGKPDYFIADYYLKHDSQMDAADLVFLTKELSYDAAPIVLPVLQDIYDYVSDRELKINKGNVTYHYTVLDIRKYYEGIINEVKNRGIRDYNLSYDIANKYADQYQIKWE